MPPDPTNTDKQQSHYDLQRQIDRNSMNVSQLIEATARLQSSVEALVKHMHQTHTMRDDVSDLQDDHVDTNTRLTELETRLKTLLAVWGAVVTALTTIAQLLLQYIEIGI